MSRVRNADEFLLRFRRVHADYKRIFRPKTDQIRRRYTGKPERDLVDHSLEFHICTYVVNALLAALNWRLDVRPEDGLPNLISEVPVRSQETQRTRFLDYLGLERQTDNPLLIVETKRPRAQLPRLRTGMPAATYGEIMARGLAGELLDGEWNQWLKTIRDYVCSVRARTQKLPRRVVITNGDWLILFLDPDDAFVKDEGPSPSKIVVFEDYNDIENRYYELFNHLEHSRVLGEASWLTPGELPFFLDGASVAGAMHALRLQYIEQPCIHDRKPVIKVAPVIALKSRFGTWACVEAPPREYDLPHAANELLQHLQKVKEEAQKLLEEVNRRLGTTLSPSPLTEHYNDEEAFAALPGVRELREHQPDQYLIVTGDKTHYLLPDPTVPDCPYHDWATCNNHGVPSNPGPVMVRSVSPRSFFTSKEKHHCAHRDVTSAKASPITAANRNRCGARSGQEGQAFCEIWRFEQHLCCRTCAFEEVCTKAPVFHLPCSRQAVASARSEGSNLEELSHAAN